MVTQDKMSTSGYFSGEPTDVVCPAAASGFYQSRSAVMKGFPILLAALAPVLVFSLTASAQQEAKPAPGIGVENVIVTAPALRTERSLDNFIIAHSTPTLWLGKIARWKNGICPLAVGLSPKMNLYISQRIIRVAMMTGAPL